MNLSKYIQDYNKDHPKPLVYKVYVPSLHTLRIYHQHAETALYSLDYDELPDLTDLPNVLNWWIYCDVRNPFISDHLRRTYMRLKYYTQVLECVKN